MPEEKTKTLRETVAERFNALSSQYAGILSTEAFMSAFARAGFGTNNNPQIQSSRIKGIPSLPVEYSKEQIGGYIRKVYDHERELRETSQVLNWSAYPYHKIIKTYTDIPTYRYYFRPKYFTAEEAKQDDFKREAALLDKLNKEIRPEVIAHEITGGAMLHGKVIYVPRIGVDKSHNRVNYAFLQQLPINWCSLIGRNNISGWTVSFDLMYFLTPGTDVTQFGDLFLPYLDDFQAMFRDPDEENGAKYVYASYHATVKRGNRQVKFYPQNVKSDAPGNPRVFEQNGRWAYYVSLPIDRVWVFEIDDATPAIAPPLTGLMLTYAQQSDYEAIQKALYTNPLIKIFTGEIPYFNDDGTRVEDTYKLSDGGRAMFQVMFEQLMAQNNTAGAAFFTAPVENIRSHDFAESANANEISTTFNQYAGSKAGLAALIPVDKDIKAAQVEAARLIESRYSTACIYPQFEKMMTVIYRSLNLRYDWDFRMFGTIFTEKQIRDNAEKALARGDTSALFTLAALDGESWLDKITMLRVMNDSEIMDLFQVPETAYTQSAKSGGAFTVTGRPRSEGISSEAKEKSVDAGYSTTEE